MPPVSDRVITVSTAREEEPTRAAVTVRRVEDTVSSTAPGVAVSSTSTTAVSLSVMFTPTASVPDRSGDPASSLAISLFSSMLSSTGVMVMMAVTPDSPAGMTVFTGAAV